MFRVQVPAAQIKVNVAFSHYDLMYEISLFNWLNTIEILGRTFKTYCHEMQSASSSLLLSRLRSHVSLNAFMFKILLALLTFELAQGNFNCVAEMYQYILVKRHVILLVIHLSVSYRYFSLAEMIENCSKVQLIDIFRCNTIMRWFTKH